MKTTHKHHIVPRHMGGSDDPSNLVELTIEEHAKAHRILFEQHGHWEDEVAWKTLSGQMTNYEAQQISRSNAMKGFKHSEETILKLSEIAKIRYQRQLEDGTWDEANRKRSESHKGKVRSVEHAKNNRDSRLANGLPWHNADTKKSISEAMKNIKKFKCPHCDKIMGAANLAYHIKKKHVP